MRVYGAAATPLSSYTLIVGGYTKRDLLSFRGYLNFLLSLLSDACFEIDIFHDNNGLASPGARVGRRSGLDISTESPALPAPLRLHPAIATSKLHP